MKKATIIHDQSGDAYLIKWLTYKTAFVVQVNGEDDECIGCPHNGIFGVLTVDKQLNPDLTFPTEL